VSYRTGRDGVVRCNHWPESHEIPVVDGVELRFRKFLDVGGWTRNGYCYAYYPKWLRHSFRVHEDPTLPVLEDEPEFFGEGGKWKP